MGLRRQAAPAADRGDALRRCSPRRRRPSASRTRSSPTAIVAVAKRASDEIHLTGTPTFVIDGKVYGGELTLDQLKAILDPLVKKL